MKHVVECGCSYDDQKDGIWWCPLHLKAKKMELQKDELVAVAKRHREERDHYRSEVQELNRLNGELREALEKIAKIPEHWDKSYVEKDSDLNFAIEISKEALALKRNPVAAATTEGTCTCTFAPAICGIHHPGASQ